jgi:trehalose/maltose hydrolase-like predicted phosphorylase
MVAVLGFGGLRVEGGTVVLNPRLPAKWRNLEFALEHRGDRFRVKITTDAVTITPADGNVRDHAFVVAGTRVVCRPAAPVTVAYRAGAVSPAGGPASVLTA